MVWQVLLTLALIASAARVLPAQSGSGSRPTIVVLPFTSPGPAADTSALRASAQRLVANLNVALQADSGVRWLEYQPMRRPRDPRTRRIVPARYGVIGLVRRVRGDSVRVRFELVSIETMELLMRDSLTVRASEEAMHAEPMARCLVTALHEAERRPRPVPLAGDSGPAAAATLYSRALVRINRADTAEAVRLLRQALKIAPDYREACEALRQIRPGEACRSP